MQQLVLAAVAGYSPLVARYRVVAPPATRQWAMAVPLHEERARALIMQQQEQESKPRFPLPFMQPGVPEDQQPTRELMRLRRQSFMDWPADDGYSKRLVELYQGITLFLSLPIAYTTYYNLPQELPNLLVAANLGTVAAMVPFVLRLRVGWGFVSSRLLERTTYYEANQRALTKRKEKGDLLRDRLLEENEVRPVLKRIDSSLFALALALVLSFGSTEVVTALQGESGPATLKTLYGDEARRFDNRLKGDDEFAAEQQRRAQSRGEGTQPAYCDSRYYKILAGGNGQGGVGCGGQ